ncbi:immunoglobulin-like domain-containing protein [Sporosarcina aquimarina]|uniref:Bacterial Ig-like domain-containing protein n=1 Tax=Sporosarcina aquimarina TaxID=114975 RepID=A0ABU4G7C7_9BACL|nr:immunoglobulin-like domain-containing protein [Sporosarcina aquimarina]MDW0111517.1 hypothetical protein [Sporosarcina aquimarina]
MKKYLFKIMMVFLAVFLVACQQSNLEEAEIQDVPVSKEGLQVETEKDTYPTTTDEIVLVIKNESDEELNATSFNLEKKVEGIWYDFPSEESGPTDAVGGYQPPNSTSKISFFTKELKYDLAPGSYRAKFIDVAAEFQVTK